ncbi:MULTISPECIES: hypothetical protein [unclassified Streptomyces]|uniref:hypothetical protein n=1 Tax=unclassified Streptomyces TaxID=2593676 RepID=UPI00225070B9|nr:MULTISPECIES: hypothetical protein [unclassified Streptomyces]MCX4884642.1 hypothetical protein [Streptomyces sp. NBC_00847]MCX5424789.1 hypothetical protein [Streptomyces sp. NBC_00078]
MDLDPALGLAPVGGEPVPARLTFLTVGSVRALVEKRVGRSAPPPPGPAVRRDRATVLAATAGILSRGAVRQRRKLGRVG